MADPPLQKWVQRLMDRFDHQVSASMGGITISGRVRSPGPDRPLILVGSPGNDRTMNIPVGSDGRFVARIPGSGLSRLFISMPGHCTRTLVVDPTHAGPVTASLILSLDIDLMPLPSDPGAERNGPIGRIFFHRHHGVLVTEYNVLPVSGVPLPGREIPPPLPW